MVREVFIARYAGFCFGVERAMRIASRALTEARGKVYTLGPLIHNPRVVSELERKGLTQIGSLDEISKGKVIIRSHGVPPEFLEEARHKGLATIDATCPFVKKAQRAARVLSKGGYLVVVVGDRDHPEIRGIVGYADGQSIVISQPDDVNDSMAGKKVGVLAQTTQARENFLQVIEKIRDVASECNAFDTICSETALRQEAAIDLARNVDLMLVVGGRNSANTNRLATICRDTGTPTYHIESHEEIQPDWLEGKEKIGITAGASTPYGQVEAIRQYVVDF